MTELSIRSFLTTPRDLASQPEMEASNETATPAGFSPASPASLATQGTLDGDLRSLLPNLLTKADLESLSDRLSRVIRDELAQIRADVASIDAKLTALGGQQIHRLGLVRAHRALRAPPATGEQPRDIVCCLDNFAMKEDILRGACCIGTIRIDNQHISIYQDLSRYTLQARKALRPITTALQAAGIPYRWGYPFSLSARRGPDLHVIRSLTDVPSFQRSLGLPQAPVPNWLTHQFIRHAKGPPPPPPGRDQGRNRPQRDRP
ncbi:Hypothetical predicted protein [Pelobates cultripes]|uniref:Uncharacterized protein n=1 Tax=Pelobates cultripes TaxID=61616 RepID=A0AAD1RDV6_PELCU|nr:Hypothetical predicted protein [Pelobates cultripes]